MRNAIASAGQMTNFPRFLTLLILAALLITAGCAKRPPANDPDALAAYDEANDPFEPFNRAIFSFNTAFDETILEPSVRLYRDITPTPVRKGIANFVDNWQTPVTFINDILQWEWERAGTSLSRFLINSTFGLLGILDTATYWGIEGHEEDFGQSFAVWGIGEGFYIMLPFLGPSNARDFTGFMVDFFYDPVSLWLQDRGYTEIRYGRLALRGIVYREENLETLDDLSKNSTDFYAALRSAYRQLRNYEISNGQLDVGAEDDLFDEDFDDEGF